MNVLSQRSRDVWSKEGRKERRKGKTKRKTYGYKVLKVYWWENIFKAPVKAQLKEKVNSEEKEKIGSSYINIGGGKKAIKDLLNNCIKG